MGIIRRYFSIFKAISGKFSAFHPPESKGLRNIAAKLKLYT
jgi:hypothetical protein